MSIKKLNIEGIVKAIAKAIEDDAGEFLPELRQALHEAQQIISGRITTPEQILVRHVCMKIAF